MKQSFVETSFRQLLISETSFLTESIPVLTLLAQQFPQQQPNGAYLIGTIVGSLLYLALIVLIVAAMWVLFSKAGRPGWAAIVPIFNVIVYLDVAGKPIWWIVLLLIPFVNIVVAIMVTISFAQSFGKGVGFAIGLIFLPFIFYPILAFGSPRFVGPPADTFRG